MSWHSSYRDRVLVPDYLFAGRYLRRHFLDALMAHVSAVARLPVFRAEPAQAEARALLAELAAAHDQPLPERTDDVPDFYFALQRELEKRLAGGVAMLRVGLSRNDLDMTVYKMRARELLLEIGARLLGVRGALTALARHNVDTILIAQTHHQPGQPTTIAHYLAAVDDLLSRDSQRLIQAYRRLNRCPLGAAALAGSSHPLDRELTAALLGFDGPVANTYDAVAAADWQVDLVSVSQSIALNASRLVCDLLSWTSLGWYRLADGLVQGSSIMPQKRNPVALEHARTRFSRTLGAAGMVLYSSHNIPYADLNDFGPDVQGALQAQHLQLSGGLELLQACLEGGNFEAGALAAAAAATDTTATELADVLVREAGLSFPEAHSVVGALVRVMHQRGRPFAEATTADLVACGGPELEPEILKGALDPTAFVRRRGGLGMPAPETMGRSLTQATKRLAQERGELDGLRTQLDQARGRLLAH